MIQNKVYIVCAKRTPIGSFMGSLKSTSPSAMGALLIKSIINEVKLDPMLVSEVIIGQVLTAGHGQNSARQSLIFGGLPQEIPAVTVNKICASGLKAVILASNSIISGENDIVIAGGQESMSLSMHGLYIRSGLKFGEAKLVDFLQKDGLTDAFFHIPMGITAENIAERFTISRESQDEFALDSHKKASIAKNNNLFKNEIIPLSLNTKGGLFILDYDEGIRDDICIQDLKNLPSVFKKHGTVTAANSSSINDGAALLLLASEKALKKYNLKPIASIEAYASSGVDPNIMGTGPIPAVRKALVKANWSIDDLEIIESNEAFAVQAIAVNREINWDISRVNINGGALALGHPIGASGARILVTLIHGMLRNNYKKGLATLCVGGGMGVAMCIKNL